MTNIETGRTFNVFAASHDVTVAALEKLSTRLTKKGLPALVWTVGKAFADSKGRARMPIMLETSRPHFNGWHFVATMIHLRDTDTGCYENVMNTVPGCTLHDDCKIAGSEMGLMCRGVTDIPADFHTRGPKCDHCNVDRRRNDTFILRHTDGRYVQIGSTCITDFLGSESAHGIAFLAEIQAMASALIRRTSEAEPTVTLGADTYAPNQSWGVLLATYLGYVAWLTRRVGFVSSRLAKDTGRETTASLAYTMSTAPRDESGMMIFGARGDAFQILGNEYASEEQDVKTAVAAADWAENLSDADVDSVPNQYLANIRAIARTGLTSHRVIGYAGSIIEAHKRWLARGEAKSSPAAAAAPKVEKSYLGPLKQRVAFGTQAVSKATVRLSSEPVRIVAVKEFDNDFGVKTMIKFVTAEGQIATWFASGSIRAERGEVWEIIGTISRHNEFRGEKETILNRCEFTRIETVRATG